MSAPWVSVVVPVYNEAASLRELHGQIVAALEPTGRAFEMIFADDGSSDGSMDLLRELAAADPRVRVIRFRRNFGQTAALQAGFDHARGEVLVPLDADLQNDPADIPALVAKLDEGYDIVSGWRAERQDNALRRLPSQLANALIARITGVPIHDTGCTLKAYRREALEPVRLYGQLHRFIPALAAAYGARVGELRVRHHPRRHGTSKYGLGRTTKVILDLMLVKFLTTALMRPVHAFGRWALLAAALGIVAGFTGIVRWLAGSPDFGLWMIAALVLATFGSQLFAAGALAEMLTRTYHESTGRRTYQIAERIEPPRETEP